MAILKMKWPPVFWADHASGIDPPTGQIGPGMRTMIVEHMDLPLMQVHGKLIPAGFNIFSFVRMEIG